MNQILSTKLNKKTKNKKNWFKLQFIMSIFIIAIICLLGFYYYNDLVKKENLSHDLINNYSIYKLYSNQDIENSSSIEETSNGLFRHYRNTKNKYILSNLF